MDSASRFSNAREEARAIVLALGSRRQALPRETVKPKLVLKDLDAMPEGRRERCGHKLGGPNCVDREVVDEQAKADRVIGGQSVARP